MVMYVVCQLPTSYPSTTVKSVIYHELTANYYIILQLSETLVLSHVNDGYQVFCGVSICAIS
jgi:hypothetical protein